MPFTHEPELELSMKLLAEMGSSAYFLGYEELVGLTVLKMLRLTIEKGNNLSSSFAYISYAMFLSVGFDDMKGAYEFGGLALETDKKIEELEFKCKVQFLYALLIHSWNHHHREITELCKSAIESGYQCGDLEYLVYSYGLLVYMNPDIDLDTKVEEGEKYLVTIKDFHNQDMWDATKILHQFYLNLCGKTANRLYFYR